MRGKGSGAPFQLLIQLILFGRKKIIEETAPASAPASMTKLEPFPIPDTIRKTVTESDIAKADDTALQERSQTGRLGD